MTAGFPQRGTGMRVRGDHVVLLMAFGSPLCSPGFCTECEGPIQPKRKYFIEYVIGSGTLYRWHDFCHAMRMKGRS